MKNPSFAAAIFIILGIALAGSARANVNLVQDNTFTGVTYSGTAPITTKYGQFGGETGSTLTVANWTTSGYNFVFAPNTADAGTSAGANAGAPNEAPGQYNNSSGYGTTYMWGANNGGASTLPATDPAGGNFIAADGAYEVGAISQTITGLTVGDSYVVKFYWAGGQQESFSGTTTEAWKVTLGSQSITTGTLTNNNQSFTGWVQATMLFTNVTSTSETLSFLAIGTPNGQPPFCLLGGVDLELAPEASNWMVFAGFGAVCTVFEVGRRRRRQTAIAPPG